MGVQGEVRLRNPALAIADYWRSELYTQCAEDGEMRQIHYVPKISGNRGSSNSASLGWSLSQLRYLGVQLPVKMAFSLIYICIACGKCPFQPSL